MATFVPESTYLNESYLTKGVIPQKSPPTISQSTISQGYDYNNYRQECHQTNLPDNQFYQTEITDNNNFPKSSANFENFEPKMEPKIENLYNDAYQNPHLYENTESSLGYNNSYQYYSNSRSEYFPDQKAAKDCYYYNSFGNSWPTTTAYNEETYLNQSHNHMSSVPTTYTHAQQAQNSSLSQHIQTNPQMEAYTNNQQHQSHSYSYPYHQYNYLPNNQSESWPTNSTNLKNTMIKAEPSVTTSYEAISKQNKTDLSSNSIISNDCILLNTSSSSSSTCSPNYSGFSHNYSQNKSNLIPNNENSSNFSTSHSSVSSSRSSISSTSSDLHLNNSKPLISDGYFNNNYFKVSNNKNKQLKKKNSIKQEACQKNRYIQDYKQTATITKRKLSESYQEDQYSSAICVVCEQIFANSEALTNVCDNCKTFYNQYLSNKSTSTFLSNDGFNCQKNCDLKQVSCSTCRFAKCVASGMRLIGCSKLENGTQKNSLVEIRNLSIEVAVSTSSPSDSSCSYSSLVSTASSIFHNFTTLITTLIEEIELKKQVIRLANSESDIKSHFIELITNISDFILKKSNSNHKAYNFNHAEFELNRELIIAYTLLVDEAPIKSYGEEKSSDVYLSSVSTCLNPYENRFKDILTKIYQPFNQLVSRNTKNNSFKPLENSDEKLFSSFDVLDFSNQSTFPNLTLNQSELNCGFNNIQDYDTLNLPNLTDGLETLAADTTTNTTKSDVVNELKMLHFLILLFTSMMSFDEFIHDRQNDKSLDAAYCQKFLATLLDKLCEDKTLKTKILLSVSEVDF